MVFCCCDDRAAEPDSKAKIVAVDLQAMAPLEGVIQIQGDITKVCMLYTFSSSFIKFYLHIGLLYYSKAPPNASVTD